MCVVLSGCLNEMLLDQTHAGPWRIAVLATDKYMTGRHLGRPVRAALLCQHAPTLPHRSTYTPVSCGCASLYRDVTRGFLKFYFCAITSVSVNICRSLNICFLFTWIDRNRIAGSRVSLYFTLKTALHSDYALYTYFFFIFTFSIPINSFEAGTMICLKLVILLPLPLPLPPNS